jgi:hypothetical protein
MNASAQIPVRLAPEYSGRNAATAFGRSLHIRDGCAAERFIAAADAAGTVIDSIQSCRNKNSDVAVTANI